MEPRNEEDMEPRAHGGEMEPRNEEYGLGGEKERLVCTSPDCPFQRARPEGCKLTKGCKWVLKMRCESF